MGILERQSKYHFDRKRNPSSSGKHRKKYEAISDDKTKEVYYQHDSDQENDVVDETDNYTEADEQKDVNILENAD